ILAGQRVPSLKFIVDLAGPAIAIDSLMVLQSEAVMKVQGKTMSAQDRALIKKNYEIVKSKLSAEEAFEALMANMRAVPGSQNVQFGDEIGVLVTPWYRHFMKIDPIHFIKKINIPVFAAFGGTDVQVIAAPNMESLTDNLPRNLKSIVKVYPGLNHLFQTSKSGSHIEYEDIEETFISEILKDMADWILSRYKTLNIRVGRRLGAFFCGLFELGKEGCSVFEPGKEGFKDYQDRVERQERREWYFL